MGYAKEYKQDAVKVDYGLIDIGAEKPLEFYVLDTKVSIPCRHIVEGKLSNGKYAVGWSSYISKGLFTSLFRTRGMRRKVSRLEKYVEGIPIKFELGELLDEKAKDMIKQEILATKCVVCKKPTPYWVSFLLFKTPSSRGFGKVKRACEKHINEVIEKEGVDWDVFRNKTPYAYCDGKSLGQVKYEPKTKAFIPAAGTGKYLSDN